MRAKWLAVPGAVFCTTLALAGSCYGVTLLGAGSTFIYPILGKWITEYDKMHPDFQLGYSPVGSGRGIARVEARTVDFGASDGPMNDLQMKRAGREILHIPVVLGAVVPAYNLPGVTEELRFTPAALAGIYLGQIKRWNDPELTKANPGAHLPEHEIGVVFRLDSSGTTYVWVDYLSKVSAEWNKRVGRGTRVAFPVGVAANYNEGVRDFIKRRPYSIGYLQSTYAVQGHVAFGRVLNSSGNFVKADSAGVTAAAAAAATEMPSDFRVSITNAADAYAYPISSFTWLLVPAQSDSPEKAKAIAGFLRWVLTDGQDFAKPLDYAPLPGDVARHVLKAVDRVH